MYARVKTSILIRSCAHDLPYLRLCLASIKKFATGFREIVLLVTTEEKSLFRQLARINWGTPIVLKDYPAPANRGACQLAAQCEACFADKWCSESDLILFMDSDCVFISPVKPDDYLVDGKPVLLIEDYSRLPGCPWKPVVESALKRQVKYETMRRHPAVHWRDLFEPLRKVILCAQDIRNDGPYSFRRWVHGRKATFPWGFTEFNTIGAFVVDTPSWAHQYCIIDVGKTPAPESRLKQFWSQTPADRPQRPEWGGMIPEKWCRERGIV